MILADTGPLVALCNRSDPYHALCTETLKQLGNESLVTTWPCVSEAMYFLGRKGRVAGQRPLWELLLSKSIGLAPLDFDQLRLVHSLMEKYADFPMAFADASLVIAAHSFGYSTLFTLDRGFRIFRLPTGTMLKIVPDEIS